MSPFVRLKWMPLCVQGYFFLQTGCWYFVDVLVEVLLMSLAKAKSIGRKRCRLGCHWPMPLRETDLGHIYAALTIRPLAGSSKAWTGQALLDTGATDTFLPA